MFHFFTFNAIHDLNAMPAWRETINFSPKGSENIKFFGFEVGVKSVQKFYGKIYVDRIMRRIVAVLCTQFQEVLYRVRQDIIA